MSKYYKVTLILEEYEPDEDDPESIWWEVKTEFPLLRCENETQAKESFNIIKNRIIMFGFPER